jgi:hypothetical protein
MEGEGKMLTEGISPAFDSEAFIGVIDDVKQLRYGADASPFQTKAFAGSLTRTSFDDWPLPSVERLVEGGLYPLYWSDAPLQSGDPILQDAEDNTWKCALKVSPGDAYITNQGFIHVLPHHARSLARVDWIFYKENMSLQDASTVGAMISSRASRIARLRQMVARGENKSYFVTCLHLPTLGVRAANASTPPTVDLEPYWRRDLSLSYDKGDDKLRLIGMNISTLAARCAGPFYGGTMNSDVVDVLVANFDFFGNYTGASWEIMLGTQLQPASGTDYLPMPYLPLESWINEPDELAPDLSAGWSNRPAMSALIGSNYIPAGYTEDITRLAILALPIQSWSKNNGKQLFTHSF